MKEEENFECQEVCIVNNRINFRDAIISNIEITPNQERHLHKPILNNNSDSGN